MIHLYRVFYWLYHSMLDLAWQTFKRIKSCLKLLNLIQDLSYCHLYPVHLACLVNNGLIPINKCDRLKSLEFISYLLNERSYLVIDDLGVAFTLDFVFCCLELRVEELADFV